MKEERERGGGEKEEKENKGRRQKSVITQDYQFSTILP